MDKHSDPWFWIWFNLLIIALLAIDIGVFHKKSREINLKEALIMSGLWVCVAMLFNLGIYYFKGTEEALNFLTGYLIEYSLSVDNLFVFLIIFSYFHVPKKLTHTVLFWGILGAIIMRASFIFFGIILVNSFHWIIYIFGLFLILSGIKLAFQKDKEMDLEANVILKILHRIIPVTKHFVNGYFLIRENGTLKATPLLVVLLAIETSDVIFAMDSIPAIIGITKDPFIVYTSNIFAIIGLRSMFFALQGMMPLFHYLHYGLALILCYIGFKMLLERFYDIPILASLSFIFITLLSSIILSILFPLDHRKKRH